MCRQISFSPRVEKFINKLLRQDEELVALLTIAIDKLAIDPLPPQSKKLKGYPFHRFRVGKYRIIYRYTQINLHIVEIGKSDKIYENLDRLV